MELPICFMQLYFLSFKEQKKPFPPKFGGFPNGKIYLAERFEHQFEDLKNMSTSIYLLDDNNFKTFDNHSTGDNIELRVEGPQEVKGEIKITNDLDYLKENGVIFYSYQDREKVGIPKTDKYLVQGILKTYL